MPVDAQPATSFVIDVDVAGLLAGLGIDCGSPGAQEAVFAAEQAALADSAAAPADVPGRGADLLPAGPALAVWLEHAVPDRCADADLPDIADGYRRVASWAQSQELAVVAEIAARSAARHGLANDDARVLPEAAAQVALALTMSHPTAMDWTSLGIRLHTKLPGTAAAMAAGQIDLTRTRLIAEATGPLSDEAARAVEARVLPAAGEQTGAQLRASLRRAVIAADPNGADRRREHAERHARVSLYPDADGTATITGTGLPSISAAAAMARISAMARAMKTAGHAGGLDYLRAYVMLGLLLGTAPGIPGAPGAPSDDRPPEDPAPPTPAGGPVAHQPDTAEPADPCPPLPVEPPDLDAPEPPEPDFSSFDDGEPIGVPDGPPGWPPPPSGLPGPVGSPVADSASIRPPAGLLDVLMPWSAITGTSFEPAVLGRIGPATAVQARQLLDLATQHRGTQWRVILTDDDGRALAVERLRPPAPAATTSARASPAMNPARASPAMNPARASPAMNSARASPAMTTPVVGRVTVIIPAGAIGDQAPGASTSGWGTRDGETPGGDRLRAALLRAAHRAAASVRAARRTDQAASGCAHHRGTAAYRPAPRLREFVAARDLTCTFPPCGQPAWRADLDHTVPWHRGGPTCSCNLGGRCRTHHKIKQLPGWKLEQTPAGVFRWTTPAGRSYTARPARYPVGS